MFACVFPFKSTIQLKSLGFQARNTAIELPFQKALTLRRPQKSTATDILNQQPGQFIASYKVGPGFRSLYFGLSQTVAVLNLSNNQIGDEGPPLYQQTALFR